MTLWCALLVLVFSSVAFPFQDQKMANGKWAYYGEEFYATLAAGKKLDRSVFEKIFNQTHQAVKGAPDVITSQCKSSTCYRHVSVGYDQARKIMFGELDVQRDAKGTYVVDVYCNKKFYFSAVEDISRMGEIVNIEHTWPQSKFNVSYPKDMQKSDMHHLYPSDSHANSTRGNTPFGLVMQLDNRFGADGCGGSRMGFVNAREVYTPPAPHRGNVARALFYFSMHYDLGISGQEERILRQWHKDDPVDANEVRRHEAIARYQKVRNPFVDYPEIVDQIADF
jgi:deoxyribonuclease-1